MSLHFDEMKATQVAARFLRLRGGQMHYLKLVKLLYLLDREALLRWGVPVTTDNYASMEHGPVVSRIYDLIAHEIPKPQWGEFISAPFGDYEVRLIKEAPADRLSTAEEKLIDEIYKEYGYLNRWKIVDDICHKLPEWTDPGSSSIPIHIREILQAGGESEDEIRATLRELRGIAAAEEILEA